MGTFRSKRWQVVLILGAPIAAFLVWNYWPAGEGHITIGYDTTRITGPVRPDGTVDYIAYLNNKLGHGVTPENNAAIPLLKIWGSALLGSAEYSPRQVELLGLKSVPSDRVALNEFPVPRTPETSGPVDREFASKQLLDSLCEKPWSAPEHPEVVAWLNGNAEGLRTLAEAAARPRFFIPFFSRQASPSLMECNVPAVPGLIVPRLLGARAMLRLSEGDIASAQADVLTLHRLARLYGQCPDLVVQMLAIGVENHALKTSTALATSSRLNKGQMTSFLAALANLPPMPDPLAALEEYERFVYLDCVGHLAQRPGRGLDGSTDWDYLLRQYNLFWDVLIARYRKADISAKKLQAAREMSEWLGQPEERFVAFVAKWGGRAARGLRTKWTTRATFRIITPVLSTYSESGLRMAQNLTLAQVAAALSIYRMQHNAYPKSLDDLTSILGGPVPPDSFGGKALIYRVTDSGCILYSVGPNGKDDGGDSAKTDDLAVTFP
ncbi:MAG: hypothetical protein LLG01_11755 [Planctomycetaceae bacterium]|nr:hypothetical protein [Planctomycetaceae bacterium]